MIANLNVIFNKMKRIKVKGGRKAASFFLLGSYQTNCKLMKCCIIKDKLLHRLKNDKKRRVTGTSSIGFVTIKVNADKSVSLILTVSVK